MCKPHADRPAGSTFLKRYAVAVRVAAMNQPKPGHRQTALTDLTLHPQNPRHGDIGVIVESIEQNGWIGSLVAQCSTGHVLAGNHRMQAAAHCGFKKLPTHWIDCDDAAALRILLSDNRSSDLATNDDDILAELLTALVDTNDGLAGTGYDGDDLDLILADVVNQPEWSPADLDQFPPAEGAVAVKLSERFVAPPFSILDTRQGYWRSRKQEWLSLGIQSEIGRAANLLQMSDSILLADNGIDPFAERSSNPNQSMRSNVSGNAPQFFYKKQEMEQLAGREMTSAEAVDVLQTGTLTTADGSEIEFDAGEMWANAGTSIFDPVLCEIAYRWWCVPGGTIVDPFAGGSVRGIVAGKLGYNYFGVELRAEQVDANVEQAAELLAKDDGVQWRQGDSTDPKSWADAPLADFVFTCPPYADLEIYSDDPADLSNAESDSEFFALLSTAFANADAVLQNDRFAVVVMGEVRDKNGILRNIITGTIEAAAASGWEYYNDAILITAAGSLPLRVGRIFNGGRKLGRSHQYVLVFVKGDWRKANEACGLIEGVVGDLEDSE